MPKQSTIASLNNTCKFIHKKMKQMSNFQLLEQQTINALTIDLSIYKHSATGALHIHLDAPKNSENTFLLALRTFPEDSTGVAHILEHTTLCGSKKFPVRDPFFLMIRRSLNSFMNAMTSSDWTAYPFASPNKKDFNNLLEVYLDSVFFPNLNELDFAQEGHRVAFEEQEDPTTPLVYKGVVYNEMKGAMSSDTSVLWDSLCRYLYPTSTYQHNSGGEPEDIPNLSYEQLKAFHQRFYHPSNAVFMTFGDIPASEHQQRFETLALAQFGQLNPIPAVPVVAVEQRYEKPQQVTLPYAVNSSESEDDAAKAHIVKGWLLGDSTKIEDTLDAILLSAVLLDDSASPLQQCLENTDLGTLSPLCGVETSQREICFVAGLENCDVESSAAVEKLIEDCFLKVASEGIDNERIQACFRQIELQQREITGDSMPFGLQLLMSCLPSAIHGADIGQQLNIDEQLIKLRQNIQDPNYIKDLCKRWLINNNHSVLLTLEPDTTLQQRKNDKETAKLSMIKESLNAEQIAEIIKQSNALEERQSEIDDVDKLPQVGIEDIAPDVNWATAQTHTKNNNHLHCYQSGTNGIVYLQQCIDLPYLPLEQFELLPLYSYLLTELGAAEGDQQHDYLAMQRWQSEVCSGINAHLSVSNDSSGSSTKLKATLIFSSKTLDYQCAKLDQLMHVITNGVQFDELDRIKSLIAQLAAQAESKIVGRAHSYAMSQSSSTLSLRASIDNHLTGIASVQRLKQLNQSFDNEANVATFAESLTRLHNLIKSLARDYLVIGEQATIDQYQQQWQPNEAAIANQDTDWNQLEVNVNDISINGFWQINSQVNYCSVSFSTVDAEHKDSTSLSILARVLDNHFLHSTIREKGGAYGGGCTQHSPSATFRFYSYRDPQHEATIDAFHQSLQWITDTDTDIDELWLEEAKLSLISSIDKPQSPSGFARSCFFSERNGHTQTDLVERRQQILNTTAADVKDVALKYFQEPSNKRCIIGSKQSAEELTDKFTVTIL